MFYLDRHDAGRQLAKYVAALPHIEDAIVLGLPRGGVPVAFEIALACRLLLDILIVRKIGAPAQPELALGAIASGGLVTLNARFVEDFHLSQEKLQSLIRSEAAEIVRREKIYRGDRPPLLITDRTVILVDDGLATGASMRVAAQTLRPRAAQVIIAVPVAAAATCRALEKEADRILCPFTPESFQAVSQFYINFEPTTDKEVRGLLTRHFS